MADNGSDGVSLERAWLAVGHRAGVAAGALTALVGVLAHVPLWVACARGAAAWLGFVAVTRLALAGLRRLPAPPAAPGELAEEPDEAPATERSAAR